MFEMSRITIDAGLTDAVSKASVFYFKLPVASGAQAKTVRDPFSARLCSRRGIGENLPLAKDESNQRDSFRHDVRLSISDVVFSSGRPAITGGHCEITI